MAKKKIPELAPLDFGDFLLYNHDKFNRVVDGIVGPGGRAMGGLGKDAPAEMIIAEYDKLGGLIKTKDGQKVETGMFYDFENRKPKDKIELKIALKPNRGGLKITTKEVGDELKGKGRKSKVKDEDEE